MVRFKNAHESHEHSKKILDLLYGYDSFLDSLEYVADFGCGTGLDTEWWATLKTRDDPPEPRNYKTYAVDINTQQINPTLTQVENIFVVNEDFDSNDCPVSRQIDLIWCHDAFQYVTNPLRTLQTWNKQLVENGMLILIFPQNVHYAYNRLANHSYNGCYYNHNLVNLMYMLAVNGFDCRDAYFLKEENSPWLHAAVYKSDIEPMNPKTTSWYDLAELNLLNDSVMTSLNKYGYVKQEEIITTWLDKDFHKPKE
jgi:SAM-dependent methyltransferase